MTRCSSRRFDARAAGSHRSLFLPRDIHREFPPGISGRRAAAGLPGDLGRDRAGISRATQGTRLRVTAGGQRRRVAISPRSPRAPQESRVTQDIFFTVLPSAWPLLTARHATGSMAPISLASISPTPFVWKTTHAASTSYQIGAKRFGGSNPLRRSAVHRRQSEGGDGSRYETSTIITFKNTKGWPSACAPQTAHSAVRQGKGRRRRGDQSISISTANTTALVFSKSSCRAVINMFNC